MKKILRHYFKKFFVTTLYWGSYFFIVGIIVSVAIELFLYYETNLPFLSFHEHVVAASKGFIFGSFGGAMMAISSFIPDSVNDRVRAWVKKKYPDLDFNDKKSDDSE